MWIIRYRASLWAYALLMASLIMGGDVYGDVNHEEVILSKAPEVVALDMVAGVLVMRLGSTLTGRDVRTGEERWTFRLTPPDAYPHIKSGKSRLVVLYPKVMALVLDMATGQEVWRTAQQDDGDLLDARFIEHSDWLRLAYRRTVDQVREDYVLSAFLHNPDGSSRYHLPDNYLTVTFSPTGQQLGLSPLPQKEGGPYKNELVYWDYTNDLIEPHSSWPSETRLRFTDILAKGAALAYESDEDRTTHYIFNPHPAPALHPLGDSRPFAFWPQLLDDRRHVLMADIDPGLVRVYDGETQGEIWTLQERGHTFIPESLSTDSGGRQWMLSRDYLGHVWLWPVEPGGRPRKSYDATAHYVGNMYGIHHGHIFIGSKRQHEQARREMLHARKLDDMSLTAVWEMTLNSPHDNASFSPILALPCSQMVRCMAGVWIKHQEREPSVEHALVYERDNSAPLLMVPGRGQALSPDGRHAVISTSRGIKVHHVDSGAQVIEIATEKDLYVPAAFSTDGARMAVYNPRPPLLSVWNLDKDYKETVCYFPQEKDADRVWPYSLSFSQDGTLLLGAGRGRAWLYDTESGAHLRTFAEPHRFIDRRPGMPQVLGIDLPWLVSAQDFAGRFTDRFKRQPELEGTFPANGRQVFTLAEGRLLRVWDLKSGRSLRTIEPAYPHMRSAPAKWISTDITLSDNGAYAFFADQDNSVGELWDISSARQLRQYSLQLLDRRPQIYIPDDGSCVYIVDNETLKCLPGSAQRL